VSASHDAYTIVGLGELLWDILPSGRQLGGAPSNFAYHAQALGAISSIVSSVGIDASGKDILDQLSTAGLNTSYIATDEEHPTGTVTVALDDDGIPGYTIHKDAAWDFIPFNSALASLASSADAVCFGSLGQRNAVSRESISGFLSETSKDCLRVFDINLRQQFYDLETILASLEKANILKLNDDELPILATLLALEGGETQLLDRLLKDFDLQLVALTRGDKGSRLRGLNKNSIHPGYKVETKDTVGAGDSFTAALAVGLLRGDDLDELHDRANRLASFVCTCHGAMPQLPEELITHQN